MAAYPQPRWQTPLPPDVAGSWGPAVAEYARLVLGIRLDRWQRRALNRALAYGPDGQLVHRLYLVSTARQNGKTAIVRALIGWALTARSTPSWDFVLGLAHDRTQARIPYLAVMADLAPLARRLGPTARGGLSVTRYLGIRSALYGRSREYHVASREASNAIRGYSVDLGLFDEVRTQRDYFTWAALEPTTTARPDPLIFAISTAGDDRSVLLRSWWERGLRIIDGAEPPAGFGMTWYAPGDELEPDSPRAWRLASPALADGRLSLSAIAESMRTLPPTLFRQERLNLWAEAVDEWLPAGLWAAAEQPARPGLADGARIVLGVEAVPSWRRLTITVAVATADSAWVGVAGELVADPLISASVPPADLVSLLGRLVGEWRPESVAWSGAATAAPYLERACLELDVRGIALGARDLRAASELFRSELTGGRLHHAPDPLLAQQVRAARPSGPIEAGGWYLSVRESIGDVDAIRAAAWAAWAAIAPPAPEPAPPQLFL